MENEGPNGWRIRYKYLCACNCIARFDLCEYNLKFVHLRFNQERHVIKL